MGSLTPEQHYWVVQPLIDAGLAPDVIRDLLFRLCFSVIVSEGQDTVAALTGVVEDQPVAVRTAWTEVIGRMLSLHGART